VKWLATEIDAGQLPRPMRQMRDHHPNLSENGYPLVTKADILRTWQ
jgi:hypothetical protein